MPTTPDEALQETVRRSLIETWFADEDLTHAGGHIAFGIGKRDAS